LKFNGAKLGLAGGEEINATEGWCCSSGKHNGCFLKNEHPYLENSFNCTKYWVSS
jgi:hypothetical protein